LEDKIYRTIELTKTLRQKKKQEELSLCGGIRVSVLNEKNVWSRRLKSLPTRNDSHESGRMLDAVAALDPEMAEGSDEHTSARCKAVWKPPQSHHQSRDIQSDFCNIGSDGDTEYTQLAEFVDSRMREISSGTLTVDSTWVAIRRIAHSRRTSPSEACTSRPIHNSLPAARNAPKCDRLLKVRSTVVRAELEVVARLIINPAMMDKHSSGLKAN
jgi:hypothetical protein